MLLRNELKDSKEPTCIQPFDEPDVLLTIIHGSPPVSGDSSRFHSEASAGSRQQSHAHVGSRSQISDKTFCEPVNKALGLTSMPPEHKADEQSRYDQPDH
jgi:hypothetical protein